MKTVILLAIDKNNSEFAFSEKPWRNDYTWIWPLRSDRLRLPAGTIEKLIGRKLTWEDEPVEYEG